MAFDEPLIDRKIALDTEDDEGQSVESRIKRKSPEGTKDALRQSFETTAKRRRPVAIFIDEAQHLGKVSGVQLQNQLDCIKSLADDTGAVIVLIGTYELLPLRNLSAQLKHWEFCYERSIGCVGNLRLMLVRAVHAALWADAKTLNWNHLKTHAFTEAESYEMMREAYEGEKELASKPKQHADLLKMLGLAPQYKPRSAQQSDVPGTDETTAASEETQVEQPDETANGARQVLPTEEAPSETPSELNPVHGDQPDETIDEARQVLPIEETPPGRAPPKPLKKPNIVTSQPFRRKTKRDRTGGPHQKNEEQD